jgi:hypothetical protein
MRMQVIMLDSDPAASLAAEGYLGAHEANPPELHPGADFIKGLLFGTLLSLPFWIGVIWLIAS